MVELIARLRIGFIWKILTKFRYSWAFLNPSNEEAKEVPTNFIVIIEEVQFKVNKSYQLCWCIRVGSIRWRNRVKYYPYASFSTGCSCLSWERPNLCVNMCQNLSRTTTFEAMLSIFVWSVLCMLSTLIGMLIHRRLWILRNIQI